MVAICFISPLDTYSMAAGFVPELSFFGCFDFISPLDAYTMAASLYLDYFSLVAFCSAAAAGFSSLSNICLPKSFSFMFSQRVVCLELGMGLYLVISGLYFTLI